jgi:hypothetical protein
MTERVDTPCILRIEIGLLRGKRIERREQGLPGEFADIENMTADELKAFVAKDGGGDTAL